MNILLDSSVIVSLFINDKHKHKAEEIFTNIFNGELQACIPDLVLVEICSALRRRTNKESAERAYKKVEEWQRKGILSKQEMDEEILPIACSFAINYGVKGADALITAYASYYGLKLATFDDEIKEKLKEKLDFYNGQM
ncbi:MAG: PIN domain-containing protein [bacterium]|nr:PIN domain-containing protein [bacterium]